MKYINKATGAIVDVKSILGGAWEPLEAPTSTVKTDETKTTPAKKRKSIKE